MTDFQRHFIKPMLQQNAEFPLVFIEILANMAEDSPLLMQSLIEALRHKSEWYQNQADFLGKLRTLIAVETDAQGVK